MTVGLCRTIGSRNASQPAHPSHAIKADIEWITISISSIIFVLAFLGNTAALVVMFGKQGPVRLTNSKYLVNLACADLLRACFMPFTIIARMRRNFMFGWMICKILPVVQGLSVAVDVFTLVCISVERYLAICHPLLILSLRSARFSTLLNGLILTSIWILGLLTALPNLHIYNLCSLPKLGRFKCEKTPSKLFDERVYMIVLDAFYFLIPILVMIVLYTSIIWKMYRNSTAKKMRALQKTGVSKTRSFSIPLPFKACMSSQSASSSSASKKAPHADKLHHQRSPATGTLSCSIASDDNLRLSVYNPNISPTKKVPDCAFPNESPCINRPLHERSPSKNLLQRFNSKNSSARSAASTSRIDRHRRKALKLLIILILEFFICWTPLFIYHTLGTFNKAFYRTTSNVWGDLILLFSFASALSNPLTYYFMSKRYRSVLYAYLTCCCRQEKQQMLTNQRQQQAKRIMKVLRSSQKNNSSDKHSIEPMRVNLHRHSRLRPKNVF